MPAPVTVFLTVLVAGAMLLVVGVVTIRRSGARVATGRRFGGARAVSIAELQDLAAADRLPNRPVRIAGRVRCTDPLQEPGGDRVVALHRDVEVQLQDGAWRPIERLREARAMQLWERAVAIDLDLGQAAEPLISLPHVWEGTTAELGPSFRSAVARIIGPGDAPRPARSTTRRLTVVDQLIVLAAARRGPGGRAQLTPPPGGFLVTNLELDAAMRLLAGRGKSRMRWGFGLAVAGAALSVIGLVGAGAAWLAG